MSNVFTIYGSDRTLNVDVTTIVKRERKPKKLIITTRVGSAESTVTNRDIIRFRSDRECLFCWEQLCLKMSTKGDS